MSNLSHKEDSIELHLGKQYTEGGTERATPAGGFRKFVLSRSGRLPAIFVALLLLTGGQCIDKNTPIKLPKIQAGPTGLYINQLP
ncbi:hypothetical protein A3J19_04545 [Candidatus Daviesbacteria bacterium RIFCSPLOWO2_02_FULL_41_8]|uniref:Uncharacterized protein n=2 Tax=Candidatus Daviesiibacteriota TaxID=1752718 RepID=A0A1F5NJ93_9BACT|nr:MAG: hypothetical protein A2871_03120 [Candidatus Daviesbacteria bacterium RIFCSPHIGHO2_01_FULL_41_23]OGE61922.1 MAG: hypothetical protein A2967_02935 [Candidatus Daviesbacteria bacterium RIFCSPLOWO2_01_FULL_41_32]OGE77698.1 MAG: hypothetical protein A3J19_04545 [Candidatus Daviesbacteria bacterium RIFCSPLOWO2_02_FULL_41_8]